MVNYLSIVEKHAFDVPYIAFKLYNNVVWVDLDPCPNRGLVEAYFRLSKKASVI